jgi:NAD(P)-dependent dehydrogenase (short-subunit alcohol dehydrogenase family)
VRLAEPRAFKAINYAHNESRAEALLEELDQIPRTMAAPSPRFSLFKADVGDRPSLQALVRDTVATFGRLDIVISNAGWTRVTDFADLEQGIAEEDWDRCFLYNVKAHLWLMHAAKSELERNEGAFVTTASVAGVKPSGSSLAYSVTKAACIHLTKGLAVICGPRVRVNAVSPGLLLTEWGMKFPEEKREAAREATKLKRLPTVEVSLFLPWIWFEG